MRRLAIGFTQEELAKMIGISRTHLIKIEKGTVTPQVSTVQILEKRLGVTLPRLERHLHERGPKYLRDLAALPKDDTADNKTTLVDEQTVEFGERNEQPDERDEPATP